MEKERESLGKRYEFLKEGLERKKKKLLDAIDSDPYEKRIEVISQEIKRLQNNLDQKTVPSVFRNMFITNLEREKRELQEEQRSKGIDSNFELFERLEKSLVAYIVHFQELKKKELKKKPKKTKLF